MIPYDDRDGKIWFDGEMLDWRDAKIHVLNHGLHYASAVFEGVRMYDGKVFKLREHSQRLIDSGKMLGMKIPYSAEELDAATIQACEVNNIVNGYIRPIAWRGSEMMAISNRNAKVHVAVAAWEWPSYFKPEIKEKGVRLQFAKWKRPSPETEPTASKAAGLYMICTLSKHAAEDEGFDDAMMLDWRGYVAEATGANVFFVQDGVIHTPPTDAILDGITRRTVIGLAEAKGIEVVVRHIRPEELSGFTECFLTGTAAEVTPVSLVGEYTFTPGDISLGLMEDYGRLVRRQA